MLDVRSSLTSQDRTSLILQGLAFLVIVVAIFIVSARVQNPTQDAMPEAVVVSRSLFPLRSGPFSSVLAVCFGLVGDPETNWQDGGRTIIPSGGDRLPMCTSREDMDPSVKPGEDFYRYANGSWLANSVIPAGQQSYDTRAMLKQKTREQVRDLIQHAAATHSEDGSIAQKVGDYFASFMDEASIELKGFTPLADEMAAISAITNKTALSAYLGNSLNSEVDGLTANADHVLGVWFNQGFDDSEHNLPHLWQGGLGLPDRENYIDPSPKMVELRAKYLAHIAAVLKLAGVSDSETRAVRILSLETDIARTFAPDSDAADVFKQNNPWKRADFDIKAPGMDWEAYFKSAGLAGQQDFVVWQPSAVTGISALANTLSIDQWKDYLRFHLIEHYARVLPRAAAAEYFSFYGQILTGTQQAPNRVEAAVDATTGALPQAVGQLYAQHYFPPEAKAKAQAMVSDLISAFPGSYCKSHLDVTADEK